MDVTHWPEWVISAISGSVFTSLVNYSLGRRRIDRDADNRKHEIDSHDELKRVQLIAEDALARTKMLLDQATRDRNDMHKELLDLRGYVLRLQQDNLSYVRENSEQKAQIAELTRENISLKGRVVELEHTVMTLKNNADATVLAAVRAATELSSARIAQLEASLQSKHVEVDAQSVDVRQEVTSNESANR